MKTNIRKLVSGLLGALALIGLVCVTARAERIVIGVSPFYSPQDGKLVFATIMRQVLERASPGDWIGIFDAHALQPISGFLIPEGEASKQNVRARANRFGAEMMALQAFLLAERHHAPEMADVIDVPGFVDLAGGQLRKGWESMRIILIASPFFMSVENSAFNMRHGYWPSDGHLACAPSQSVFSTLHRKHLLKGVTIHWAYQREEWANDSHKSGTSRFWSVYFQALGGCLATFAPSIDLAFQRAQQNITVPCIDAQVDPQDMSVEMRSVVRRSVAALPPTVGELKLQIPKVEQTVVIPKVQHRPASIRAATMGEASGVLETAESEEAMRIAAELEKTWAAQDAKDSAKAGQPASPETASSNAAAFAAAKNAVAQMLAARPGDSATVPTDDKLLICIIWEGDADLDLYVRPTPTAKELCHSYDFGPEGRYFRETLPFGKNMSSEMVELNPPHELEQVTAWVNLASGWLPSPARGTFLVGRSGEQFRGEFIIPATHGNKGAIKGSRSKDNHWAVLDLAGAMGLRDRIRPVVDNDGQRQESLQRSR